MYVRDIAAYFGISAERTNDDNGGDESLLSSIRLIALQSVFVDSWVRAVKWMFDWKNYRTNGCPL